MPSKQRDIFVLFVGDLHCGSTYAPCPRYTIQTQRQSDLNDAWESMVKRALAEAKGQQFYLMLGGDLVDGARHHGTWETWGTPKEQRDGAVSLLQPLANAASDIYAILGTEAHSGPKGDDDRSVAEELGAKSARYAWRMTIGGRRLLWTHHGVPVARDPWNRSNGAYAMAKRLYEISLRAKEEPPSLAVFHNAHFADPPVTANGVTVAVCPCWQLSTGYGYKIAPERVPDIGVLGWAPVTNKLERWLYPIGSQSYEEIKAH